MNAFHIIGIITAVWAVVLASMGIWGSHEFPRGRLEKVVGLISLLLVLGSISAAIITSGNEEDEHGGGAEEATKTDH